MRSLEPLDNCGFLGFCLEKGGTGGFTWCCLAGIYVQGVDRYLSMIVFLTKQEEEDYDQSRSDCQGG
jgi:hypothetical protein